ncbi:MAG: radical SAM protein [Spirochaetales bacterium]|nr:radical SAM protein [Spirochaetales bacterium]
MIAPSRQTFWTRKTINLLTNRAKDTTYHFAPFPEYTFNKNYGIYVHVPFCRSFCRFCPYYKETYDRESEGRYVAALEREIAIRDFSAQPKWMYFGGGTPNTLSLGSLERILSAFYKKVSVRNIGMEVSPAQLDESYLKGLAGMGIRKVSIGIESFSRELLKRENRSAITVREAAWLLEQTEKAGLWVNIDMMVGFENQKVYHFRKDMDAILRLRPNQLTIYPVMTIRGTQINRQTMDDLVQFRIIEQADRRLKREGYRRKTLWTFGRDSGLYDSSYDELGSDYMGFGPSGISSTRGWVAVNLPLDGYLKSMEEKKHRAFVNRHVKISAHEAWRRFGMMLYERKLGKRLSYPLYMNLFISFLQMSGYAFFGRLTPKGYLYAHRLTKAVVETKSFPLQHHGCVANWSEYEDYARKE